jgi:putative tryptophan/tyrosine transport system substrate-binding protein
MLYPEKDPQGELRAGVFQRELEKAGWRIGGNLQIDFHWGTGDAEWVRSAAEQMLQQAPDVMLANGDAAVKAAQQSTRTVPVIFIASGDPVGDGLVASLAHPGGKRSWSRRWAQNCSACSSRWRRRSHASAYW